MSAVRAPAARGARWPPCRRVWHDGIGGSGSNREAIAGIATQKTIAFEFGISINTVGNLAVNAYKKLGVHGAAAAVHAHRDAHFYCGTRVDFGPIRERLKASCSTPSCS
jgi:hypothetical protein